MKETAIRILSILLLPLVFSGCAVIAAGSAAAGGALWYKGELKDKLPGSVEQVYKAAFQAIKGLKLTIKESKYDKLKGEINSEMSDGTDVKVSIEFKAKSETEVKVRVGIMGNETMSRQIISEIKTNLDALTKGT